MASNYKHVTLTGEAGSIEEAIRQAVALSGEAVHGQSWLEVKDIRCDLASGGVVESFQVTVEIAFAVDESKV